MRLTNVARQLRKRQTPQEIRLWSIIRSRKIQNLKFRRQYPIDRYIVDFCCPEKKLIIELDGGGHNTDDQKMSDNERDLLLQDLGFKVLRIWNNELDTNMEGVIEKIIDLSDNPSLQPSSARGEGE